jgi:tRNA threonylcarbamoyladenosine biosynthesis protein TsaE
MIRRYASHSEADTIEIGRRLAGHLSPGMTVLLSGDLGAGKTAFVRGLAAGLGIDAGDVSSPTFTLVQEYRGPIPLVHVDLYRITTAEADDLGLDELPEGRIVAIEWAEKLAATPAPSVRVTIEDAGDDKRIITISPVHSER